MEKNSGTEQKKAYSTPALSQFGNLIEITQRYGIGDSDILPTGSREVA